MEVYVYDQYDKKDKIYLNNNNGLFFQKNIVCLTNNKNFVNNKNIFDNLYEITENDLLSNNNNIELVNTQAKFFIKNFHISFFHFFMETLPAVIDIVEKNDNPFIVIDCTFDTKENVGWSLKKYNRFEDDKIFYLKLIVNYLEKNNIKYLLLKNDYAIKINNCYFVNEIKLSNKIFNEINKIIMSYNTTVNQQPFKKVYLSKRQSNSGIRPLESFDDYKYSDAMQLRIMNEHLLELFLQDLGFEIINTETDFKTMEDQIKYFNDVKTIFSVTQAGLINSLFINNGGNIIELISPMFVGKTKPYDEYHIHSYFYMDISYSQEHLYVGVKNLIDANLIIKNIEQNKTILDILKN